MEKGEIAPQEQFLLLSTIFCNLISDFCVKTSTRFSLRDKRLFEITEVEITGVDCIFANYGTNIKEHKMMCRDLELISCNCCNYMSLTHGRSQGQHSLQRISCSCGKPQTLFCEKA